MKEHATQPSLLDPGFGAPPARPPQWTGVARVAIDSPLPHLDRLFDYGIPDTLDEAAQIGARVRVRFGASTLDGFIIDRLPGSARTDLKPLRRVVGAVPVLTPEVLQLCQTLAARFAGGLSDMLRLAIPPRHATVEKEVLGQESPDPEPAGSDTTAAWEAYPAGAALLRRLHAGQGPRAVWSALPGPAGTGIQHWAQALTAAAQATVASGRSALLVVPTTEDLTSLTRALDHAALGYVQLTAELGPARRYGNFLQCLLGRTRIVIGTRAAAYAPIPDLGLIACWDEVHSSYAEPRAPYPHTRDVLTLRAEQTGAGLLLGGFARSPQAEHLVSTGWAHSLLPPRPALRAHTPRITAPDEHDLQREGPVGRAQIPSLAWREITQTLKAGPVLLQSPRAGYVPGLACARCRHTARCTDCHGPLSLTGPSEDGPGSPPRCTWCARAASRWQCVHCENTTWRARSLGAWRTAEELGRAFPGVPIRVSGRAGGRIERVGPHPQLVIATPGAEPPADAGYSLTVLLDAGTLTDRPHLNAPTEALHRWLRAAALTAPAGQVLILGQPLRTVAQAAVRWDPAGFARRELAEWTSLDFPPATTVVSITGERADVTSFQHHLPEVPTLRTFGPVPAPQAIHTPAEGDLGIPLASQPVRILLRAAAKHHLALTTAIRSAIRTKSARRDGQPLTIHVNPYETL